MVCVRGRKSKPLRTCLRVVVPWALQFLPALSTNALLIVDNNNNNNNNDINIHTG